MGGRGGPCALSSNGWSESLSHEITQMVMGVRLPPNIKWNVDHLKLIGDPSGFQRTPMRSENVHKKSHYPNGSQIVSERMGRFYPQGLL